MQVIWDAIALIMTSLMYSGTLSYGEVSALQLIWRYVTFIYCCQIFKLHSHDLTHWGLVAYYNISQRPMS